MPYCKGCKYLGLGRIDEYVCLIQPIARKRVFDGKWEKTGDTPIGWVNKKGDCDKWEPAPPSFTQKLYRRIFNG